MEKKVVSTNLREIHDKKKELRADPQITKFWKMNFIILAFFQVTEM